MFGRLKVKKSPGALKTTIPQRRQNLILIGKKCLHFKTALLWLVENVTLKKWANLDPIGWKSDINCQPSHPPSSVLLSDIESDWLEDSHMTSLFVRCPETMYIYIETYSMKNKMSKRLST